MPRYTTSVAQATLFELGLREHYTYEPGDRVVRTVVTEGRASHTALDGSRTYHGSDPAVAFDRLWLRSQERPSYWTSRSGSQAVRIADLFSGCGAMSVGASEACYAVGKIPVHSLAVDMNHDALAAYSLNFPDALAVPRSITQLLEGSYGERMTGREKQFVRQVGEVDLLLAGPPCQGHSDLNNHTRREDPKNSLYFSVARFAELFEPSVILVENVPGAAHDRGRVVQRTRDALHELGYRTATHLLDASRFGVAQTRRRFFLVASKRTVFTEVELAAMEVESARTVEWAIADLVLIGSPTGVFDTPARHSAENQRRIDYLFTHDLYDLPDAERPACHRDKRHSYNSVYGRMYWNKPAQTITTGFGSTGQGRFVHPLRPRSLTPHEAARLQFIPDFFKFPEMGRRAHQLMIGNAVPPKLAYVVTALLLGS